MVFRLAEALAMVGLFVGGCDSRPASSSDTGLADTRRADGKVVDQGGPSDDRRGRESGAERSRPPGPVRIVLLLDSSGSMQWSDPPTSGTTQVQRAVQDLVKQKQSDPGVQLCLIRYNGRVTVNGGDSQPEFTSDPAILQQAIQGLAQHEATSDVQGALTKVRNAIDRDLGHFAPADRAVAKYVVVLLADSEAAPVCKDGCGNDQVEVGGTMMDSVCDLQRVQWCEKLNLSPDTCADMMGWYQGMVACKAYNNDALITDEVTKIAALGSQHGAGEIRVHAALLSSMSTQPPDVQKLFGFDKARAEEQLKKVAQAGGGLYQDFPTAQALSFDFVDASPLP
jgi:hypothetical protein